MPLRSGTPHHRGQLHSGTPAPMGVSSEGEEGGKCGRNGERIMEGGGGGGGGEWREEWGEENGKRRMGRGNREKNGEGEEERRMGKVRGGRNEGDRRGRYHTTVGCGSGKHLG